MINVTIGVQSYTYREFSLEQIPEQLADTGITAVEIWPGHFVGGPTLEKAREVRKLFEDRGLVICGYGVYQINGDRERLVHDFAIAKELGASYVSVDVAPDAKDLHLLAVEVAGELGLNLGIHNHGPDHHYSTVEDVLAVVSDMPIRFGACVDTGHYLRSGEKPEEVIEKLGKRVHAVHLKDFVDAETEVVPGTGRLDYAKVVNALREYAEYTGPLVIEYEADPANPTPGMKETVSLLKKSLGLA